MVAGLSEFPRPTNASEVRSFLGLAQQFTSYVPDLSHTTNTLMELIKKNIAFVWGPLQAKALPHQ